MQEDMIFVVVAFALMVATPTLIAIWFQRGPVRNRQPHILLDRTIGDADGLLDSHAAGESDFAASWDWLEQEAGADFYRDEMRRLYDLRERVKREQAAR